MDEPIQTPQHPGWILHFDLTIDELIRFSRAASRSTRSGLMHLILLFVCTYFTGVIATKLGFGSGDASNRFLFYVAIMVVLYSIATKFYGTIYYRNYWPEGSAALAQRQMALTAEGISVKQEYSSSLMRWPAITQIVPDETALYLMTGSGTGYTIPYRALPAGVDPAEFIHVLRSFKECAKT